MAKKKKDEKKMLRAEDLVTMDFRTALKKEFRDTLYLQSKYLQYQIANHLGIEQSYLSRMAAEHENLNIDISLICRLMIFLNDYRILKLIAKECGFHLYKEQRVSAYKGDKLDMSAELHTTLAATINSVNKYIQDKPAKDTYINAIEGLDNAVQKSIQAKRYIQKDYTDQLALDL